MKISKTRDVKIPTRGTAGSAGLDFYVPNDFKAVELHKGMSIVIPSGIKANIPDNHVLVAFNKSGVAVGKGLQVGACVVDEDYMGEIHIHVTRVAGGPLPAYINPGDKIVQFVLLPVKYPKIVLVPETHLFSKQTERGEGWKGSTGTK